MKYAAIILAAILLASIGVFASPKSYAETAIENVEIDVSTIANPQDFPFGIDCTDLAIACLILYLKGVLVRIDKESKALSIQRSKGQLRV